MASPSLTTRSAFANRCSLACRNLTINTRDNLTIASFAAAEGRTAALNEVFNNTYAMSLPGIGQWAPGQDICILWNGPEQWLALAERCNDRDLERELKSRVVGLASVVDQSDARAVVRVAGPRAREVLAKGVPIDLHPRAFQPREIAITHANHIGITLWQLDTYPTYEIALFRSLAHSFADWLEAAALEFAQPD